MTLQIRDQLQATLGAAYVLERELPGGGMASVFVAEETALRRKVAVKVLSPELSAGVNVERFNREILVAASLQHPHIVPILTAGETGGLPYYTMPFVEGESLRTRLSRSEALSLSEAVSILRDVARALVHAHERGIVHRDIKPDNVLISSGVATVTDFGIAKAITASRRQALGDTLTMVGTSVGTPMYMSPEQAAADPTTDHRTDIYAFGCVAYELLAGKPPFNATSPRKLLAAHMSEQPRSLTELRPDTPATLANLVMQCMAKDADERPQRASEVVRILDGVTSIDSSLATASIPVADAGKFWKALALYATMFVAVAVLAKAAIVGIGLPDWVFPGALIVMALGLPVILWTGYVQRVARQAAAMTHRFTPGGTSSRTRGPVATLALKAAPQASWYRTARGGVYAMGVFVVMVASFMGMRAAGIGPVGSLMARGSFTERDLVLLTDFRITGADSTLGRVVSDAVRQALSTSSALTIVSPTAAAATLGRMRLPSTANIDVALAREIAQREGVKAIIDGEVSAVDGGYILALRLLPADSGNPLVTLSAAGDGPSGLITAADKVARGLRSRIGESLRRVQATPRLHQVTTASLPALQKYSEAYRINAVERDPRRALPIAREAVAADSTFAMGWRLLGVLSTVAGRPRVETDSALRMAFRYQNRLTERERLFMLQAYYHQGPGRDRAKAIVMGERALQLGVDYAVTNNLGIAYLTRREFARAESLFSVSIHAADSASASIPLGSRITALIELGRFDAAEAAIAEGMRRFPNLSAWSQDLANLMYVRRGDGSEVHQIYDSLALSPMAPVRNFANVRKSHDAMMHGRISEYLSFVTRGFGLAGRRRGGRGDHPIAGTALTLAALNDSTTLSQIDAEVRDSAERAVRRLDATLAGDAISAIAAINRPYFALARVYASAARPDRARAMLAEWDREVRDTAVRRESIPEHQVAEAWIALADRKYDEALRLFRRGDSLPDGPLNGCTACLPIRAAVTFDAAGQADSAIIHYDLYLRVPHALRAGILFDGRWLPHVYWRLANLYEEKSNVRQAVEYYGKFIELWRDADPELQPRVREARRRLTRLAPS
jgi:tetratricopeptide (TPR) repeat protein/tRNA A-37 threonylcarbamoyl transferase component Bud32